VLASILDSLVRPAEERSTPITDFFLNRVLAATGRGNELKGSSIEKRTAIERALAADDALCDTVGLSWIDVPDDIHCVGPRHNLGDFYSADLAAEILSGNKITLPEGARLLDFGCSSGRLVRMLARYYINAECYGCDPRDASIQWAQANLPEGHFFVSSEVPPLSDIPNSFFRLVIAISVWSHFSATRALKWFREMERIIEPGGALIFSTHGYCSIEYFTSRMKNQGHSLIPANFSARRQALDKGDYHFAGYPRDSAQAKELDVKNWGMAYVSDRWYRAQLESRWRFVEILPGRLLKNQDVYCLVRL